VYEPVSTLASEIAAVERILAELADTFRSRQSEPELPVIA